MFKESFDDSINGLKKLHPLGRFAQPIEIARGVLFLASDDSSFMTGSDMVIDGGLTASAGGMLLDLPLE
jgi:NAD(P)-dependent dehydrogenase (short-subunit alcohol dehydrogenase family)